MMQPAIGKINHSKSNVQFMTKITEGCLIPIIEIFVACLICKLADVIISLEFTTIFFAWCPNLSIFRSTWCWERPLVWEHGIQSSGKQDFKPGIHWTAGVYFDVVAFIFSDQEGISRAHFFRWFWQDWRWQIYRIFQEKLEPRLSILTRGMEAK